VTAELKATIDFPSQKAELDFQLLVRIPMSDGQRVGVSVSGFVVDVAGKILAQCCFEIFSQGICPNAGAERTTFQDTTPLADKQLTL